MLIHRMVQKISRRGGKSAFLSAIGFSTKDSKMKDSKTKDGYELATKYKGWEIYTFPTSLTFPFVAYDKDKNVIKGFNLIEIKGEIDKRESASTTDDLMTPSQKRKIEELEAAIKSNQMAGHTNRVEELKKELEEEKSKTSVQIDSKSTDAPNYYQAIVEVARRQNNTKASREAIRSQLEPIVAAYNIPFNEEQFNQAFSEFRKAGNPRAAYFKGRDSKKTKDTKTKDVILFSAPDWKTTISKHGLEGGNKFEYVVVKQGKYLGSFESFEKALAQIQDLIDKAKNTKDNKSRDGRDHLMERYKGVDIFYDKTEGTYWAAPRGGIGVTGNSVGQIRSKIDTFRSQQNTHDDAPVYTQGKYSVYFDENEKKYLVFLSGQPRAIAAAESLSGAKDRIKEDKDRYANNKYNPYNTHDAKNLADLPDVKYKGYLISLNAYGEYFVSRNNHGNWQPIPNAKFGNENNAKSYIDTLPKVTTDRKSNLHPRWRKSGDKAAIRKIKDCLMGIKKTRDAASEEQIKKDFSEKKISSMEAAKKLTEIGYSKSDALITVSLWSKGKYYQGKDAGKSSFGTKSFTKEELTNLAKRGELEVNTDIKPRQHVEVRWPSGKREMVWVEDAKMTKDQNETYSQLKSQLAATERQLAQSRKLGESADVREAEAEIAQLKKQIASLEQAGQTKDSKDIYTNFFSGFLRKG